MRLERCRYKKQRHLRLNHTSYTSSHFIIKMNDRENNGSSRIRDKNMKALNNMTSEP